jgi:hypothetical protein
MLIVILWKSSEHIILYIGHVVNVNLNSIAMTEDIYELFCWGNFEFILALLKKIPVDLVNYCII